MHVQMGMEWRLLHALSGLVFVAPALLLWSRQRRLAAMLFAFGTVTSVLWSGTSWGGPTGGLLLTDKALAYLCIGYNYLTLAKSDNKKGLILAFIVCHAAAAVYFAEGYLQDQGFELAYGLLHPVWRTLSAAGSYMLHDANSGASCPDFASLGQIIPKRNRAVPWYKVF